jgi:micrococcal nuclease
LTSSRTVFLWVILWGLIVPLAHAGSGPVLPTDAVVQRVIDGDTAQLADGRLVRYIGIDAPEVRRKVGERWVVDPEPFAHTATEANRRLVEGRRVHLEYDVQTHDRFGRLLAYVYVGDQMVNAALLAGGYAQLLTLPPNVRYAEQFRALATDARREGRGLWREN